MNAVHMSPELCRELCRFSRACGAREACGVLIRTHVAGLVTITRVLETANRAEAPDAFECDSGDLVAFDAQARRAGLDIVGFWHTHTSGDLRPSSSDARGAWPASLTAIACGTRAPGVRFWRFAGDTAIEVRAAPDTAWRARRSQPTI